MHTIQLNDKKRLHHVTSIVQFDKCRIGTGARSGLLRVFAPGPGAYEPPARITKEGPRYSFGLKKPTVLGKQGPGPGIKSQ